VVGGLATAAIGFALWHPKTSTTITTDGMCRPPEFFQTADEKEAGSCKWYEEYWNAQLPVIGINLLSVGSAAALSRWARNRVSSFCIRSTVSAIAIGIYGFLGPDLYRELKDMKERRELQMYFLKAGAERKRSQLAHNSHTFVVRNKDRGEKRLYVLKMEDGIVDVADMVLRDQSMPNRQEEVLMEIDDGDSCKPISIWYNYNTKKYRAKLYGETEVREEIEKITVRDMLSYGYLWEVNISVRAPGEKEFARVLPMPLPFHTCQTAAPSAVTISADGHNLCETSGVDEISPSRQVPTTPIGKNSGCVF
jgi:hypothetical protein